MPDRREFMTGRHNFLGLGWGPIEPFDDVLPMPTILDFSDSPLPPYLGHVPPPIDGRELQRRARTSSSVISACAIPPVT